MPGLSGAGRVGRVLYNSCAEDTTPPKVTQRLKGHMNYIASTSSCIQTERVRKTEQEVWQGATHLASASSSRSQVCWCVRACSSYACSLVWMRLLCSFWLEGSQFASTCVTYHGMHLKMLQPTTWITRDEEQGNTKPEHKHMSCQCAPLLGLLGFFHLF